MDAAQLIVKTIAGVNLLAAHAADLEVQNEQLKAALAAKSEEVDRIRAQMREFLDAAKDVKEAREEVNYG